jgi:hypothetical protein
MEIPSLGGWTVILQVFSRVPSDRGAPLFNLSQREVEGERSPSHAKSRSALAELCHESASSSPSHAMSRQLKEKGHSAG